MDPAIMERKKLEEALHGREVEIINIRTGMDLKTSEQEKAFRVLALSRLESDVKRLKECLGKLSSGTSTPFTPVERLQQEAELERALVDDHTTHSSGWNTPH